MWLPGPASTVGERSPTNPAIQVRFKPEADDTSFSPLYAILCETSIYRITLFKRKSEGAIYWRYKKRSSTLSLYEKGTYLLKIGSMTSLFQEVGNDVILLYYATLTTILATCDGISKRA